MSIITLYQQPISGFASHTSSILLFLHVYFRLKQYNFNQITYYIAYEGNRLDTAVTAVCLWIEYYSIILSLITLMVELWKIEYPFLVPTVS